MTPTNHTAADDDGDEAEEEKRKATMAEDPDFDPDNVVIRGTALDSEDDCD